MNSCISNTTDRKQLSEKALVNPKNVSHKKKRLFKESQLIFKNNCLTSSLCEALDSASSVLPDSTIKAVTITFLEMDNLSCSMEVGYSPQCPLTTEQLKTGGFFVQNGIVCFVYDPFIKARQEKYLDEDLRLNPALDSLCAFNSSRLRAEDDINIIGSSIYLEFNCKEE